MRTPVSVGVVVARPAGVAFAEALDRVPAIQIAMLCDRRTRRGGERIHVAGAATRAQRIPELLESEHIDAIAVSGDPDVACAVAEAALAAEKHVLVDGLLAASVEDAERVLQVAADHGRVVSSLQPTVLDAATQELKALIARNRLGDVCYLRAVSHAQGRREDSVWGLVAAECARILDVVVDEPLEVVATAASYGHDDVDVATCILRFATGISARIDVSLLDARFARRLAVVGSAATAVVDAERPQPLTIYDAAPFTEAQVARRGDVFSPAFDRVDPLVAGGEAFARAVRTSARASNRDAVVLVALIAALQRSLADGGAVTSPGSLRPELRLVDVGAASA